MILYCLSSDHVRFRDADKSYLVIVYNIYLCLRTVQLLYLMCFLYWNCPSRRNTLGNIIITLSKNLEKIPIILVLYDYLKLGSIRPAKNGVSKSEKWFCPKLKNFHIFSSQVAGKCARINMNPSLFQNFDSRPIGLRCVV